MSNDPAIPDEQEQLKTTNAIEDAVKTLLEWHDPKPEREGLTDTPTRVAKAMRDMTAGYHIDIASLFTTFDAENFSKYRAPVSVSGIKFYSMCEHHMLPFFGEVGIMYKPNEKIVGLSKLARLVDAFSKRFQTQERMTTEIAEAIAKHLQPIEVHVAATARHMCMEARGVCKPGAITETSVHLDSTNYPPR